MDELEEERLRVESIRAALHQVTAELEARDDEAAACGDLVAALGVLQDPPKEGKVAAGQRRYTYLTLVDLLGAVRPVFAAHNLAVMQDVETLAHGGVLVTTRIMHASGKVFTSAPLTMQCNLDPQSIGSAITYGRRYSLGALVGLAGEDDDGQAAQNPRGNTPEVFNQTRPVTRAQKAADDPADAPYQVDPTPVTQGELGDVGTPSNTTQASRKSVAMMWALQREAPMTDDEFRAWVATLLALDTPEWHTADLTQAQVSAVIDRLKGGATIGPDRRRAGQ